MLNFMVKAEFDTKKDAEDFRLMLGKYSDTISAMNES
jgi:hypothetical protein